MDENCSELPDVNFYLRVIFQWDSNLHRPIQLFDPCNNCLITPADFSISLMHGDDENSILNCKAYTFNRQNAETCYLSCKPPERIPSFTEIDCSNPIKCQPNSFVQFFIGLKSLSTLKIKFLVTCDGYGEMFAAYIGPQFSTYSPLEIVTSLIDKELTIKGQLIANSLLFKSFEFSAEFSKGISKFDLAAVSHRPLLIGHRGSGCSYVESHSEYMENTINSFEAAWNAGVDFVELDVQLTKDKSLVVYHDFSTSAIVKNRRNKGNYFHRESSTKTISLEEVDENSEDSCSSISLSISQLYLKQLKGNTFYNSKSDEIVSCDITANNKIGVLFPTLSEVLGKLNPGVGVNIEIKSPQLSSNGICEAESDCTSEKNFLVDKVLISILESKENDRQIIISSFDPSICIIMKAKQDRYPVMFLFEGKSVSFQGYKDMRTSSIGAALIFAEAEKLDGVVVCSNHIMDKIPILSAYAHSRGLYFMTYGVKNNNIENVILQTKSNVDGIISDMFNSMIPHLKHIS